MKRLLSYGLASLTLAFPAFAFAADAYVTGNVNMRAGPDTSYPLIDQIPAGSEVDVQGCTQGWEWCDVISYNNRGWVAGNYIQYEYRDRPVLLPSYGAQIGIPIVSFVIGTYWDDYYRNRPFYRQRDDWYHRPYVRRPPPRPLPHPVRPRPGRPGMPGSRPGHLGPVSPWHDARPGPDNRPTPGSRPPFGNRPMPGSRPTQDNHPGPAPRPSPGIRPGQGNRPVPDGRPLHTQRPPMQRPAPAARPAPSARPAPGGNRPASRPAPAKGGAGPRPNEKKDDNRGH